MDHPWRPPPPIPGNPTTTTNICPICSISHFPFCPSPIENPRFHYPHPPHDYYHHPPPPPFNHHPLPNHNINNNNNNNYYSYSNSSHNRPPTWHGSTNPSLNISQYDGIIDHNLNNNYHYGYDGYNNGYDNAGMKRMRIEPVDNNNIRGPRGLVMGGEIGDVSRFPSDNERILKLIHDHGNDANAMTSGPPTVGVGLFSDSSSDVGLKRRREATEISSMASDYHRHSGQPAVGRSVDVDNRNSQAQYYWTENKGHYGANHGYCGQPPLPASPPPPLPEDMPRNHFYESHASATPPPPKQTSLFPVGVSSSADASSGSAFLENQSAATVYYGNNANRHASSLSPAEAEDSELSKSSGSLRGKRQVMKTVMEYCYEPEMEEAYRASMLKAFKKTLDEGVYSFIIVDDRNLRVADFAQFWATAKRSGYEVYLVEASYKDPAGCAARNVHNFTLSDIQKMAGQWEEAPPLYLKMDIKSLLHGGGLVESGIQEVDMDMEDEDVIDASQESDVKRPHDETKDQVDDFRPHDELKDVTVTTHQTEEVKALSRSKWSNNFDAEEEDGKKEISGGALSGLVQAYSSKEGKSVCWGDQGGNVGFSISATRKTNTRSLVIGPGPGYNLKSNPLSEEEYIKPSRNAVEPRTQSVFQERIRAERESFKAVFDKRRQRIGGFNMDDE
ncbi:hypothetical protein M8C21_032716 [Ambrosia artemisiifolia]|uniref:Uncharacterized protein n=1 Tax=Ambrosia artemisiifolia TaxID=4212 RepID=A0AAD5G273_AMBAR|nr:hypothetical protein M8C21_032716 [Ambrosia artemisiifolia]